MNRITRVATIVGALVGLAVLVTGCDVESNEASVVETSQQVAGDGAAAPAETTAPAAPDAFVVGQQVALGDWTLIVHAVTDPFDPADGFSVPAEGMRFVMADAEVGYTGTDPQVVSTLICFEVQDSENRAHNLALVTNPVGDLDGDIAPGASRRGGLVWEVPADATGLRLNFKCDLMSAGAATVQLTP